MNQKTAKLIRKGVSLFICERVSYHSRKLKTKWGELTPKEKYIMRKSMQREIHKYYSTKQPGRLNMIQKFTRMMER